MSRRTPPPPKNQTPTPPEGWFVDPLGLTGDEVSEFCRYAGAVDMGDVPNAMLPGLVAIAYARRTNPEGYPWESAGRIPISVLRIDDEDQGDEEDEEAAYAEEVTEAALSGEDVPLPPPFGD